MVNNQPAKRGAILVVAASALIMLLLIAALTTFPFQLVRNADGAMEPALKDQQRLVVNKLIYRLRDPRSGEVVMMLSPLDPNRLFVRRVIGRAGDTVRIIGGVCTSTESHRLTAMYPPSSEIRRTGGRRLSRRVITSC